MNDDKDVRRLEDRIDAVNRESQLRLEGAMNRVLGKLEAIDSAVAEVKSQGRENRSIIIASALVVLFGVLGTLIGLKQVWIGGVQTGLAALAIPAGTQQNQK